MILVTDHASGFGGGQTVLMQIVESVRNANTSYLILIPKGGHRYEQLKEENPGKVYPLPQNHKNLIVDIIKLNIGLFLSKNIWRSDTILYVNGSRLLPFVVFRAIFSPFKSVAVHLHLEPSKFVLRMINLLCRIQPLTSIICCSEYIYSTASKKIKNCNILLLENALSARYAEYAGTCTTKDILNSRLEVAIVGGVHPNKGQDIIRNLPKELEEKVRFHIVGPIITNKTWADELKYNAPKHTIFAGPKFDLIKYFQENNIEVSVVPSRWPEPFGLVAIESMALNTVTLARAVGNFPFIASKTGMLLFKTDDELYLLLRKLIDDGFENRSKLKLSQRTMTLSYYGRYHIDAVLEKIRIQANSSKVS